MGSGECWVGKSQAEVEQVDVEEIREWVLTQPHLPHNIPCDLFMSFLHSNYLNIEKTKKTIETYYHIKSTSPEFFLERNLDNDAMKHILTVVEMCVLPERTDRGYMVLIARLKDPVAGHFVLQDAVKLLFMMVDLMLRRDPVPKGVLFIYDNIHVSFTHLTRLTLSVVRKYFVYIQEAIPVRMKAIHVVNVNAVVAHVMALIKPFMHKEHADQIIMHSPGHTQELYDTIPQHILPEDYGGKQLPMSQLAEHSVTALREHANWFKQDELIRGDETKRVPPEHHSSFLGFFKKFHFT